LEEVKPGKGSIFGGNKARRRKYICGEKNQEKEVYLEEIKPGKGSIFGGNIARRRKYIWGK